MMSDRVSGPSTLGCIDLIAGFTMINTILADKREHARVDDLIVTRPSQPDWVAAGSRTPARGQRYD
jgi:hypothetical protein